MKTKISQFLFTFFVGAHLATSGVNETQSSVESSLAAFIDQNPVITVEKLDPSQTKSALDLKIQGVDAYVVTIKNQSKKRYLVSLEGLKVPALDYETSKKILQKKSNPLIGMATSVAGYFFTPISIAGGVANLVKLKKSRIMEGRLKAILLDQEIVGSYSSVSRVILVAKDQKIKGIDCELIDMQTMKAKKVQLS